MANHTNTRSDGKYRHEAGNADALNDEIEQRPRDSNQAKAIAFPLLGLVVICIVIFLIKLKYGKRKIGAFELPVRLGSLEPSENPLNIRFKHLVGRGSFGVVWKASLDDVMVAVKMCSVENADRWEKERRILIDVEKHPNVIEMLESEVRRLKDENALVIVFEFIDGGDLRSYLMENKLNIDKALFLLKSLFDGLRFLHSQKRVRKKRIVHRDIKSSNVLVSNCKGCVIADFGLALSINEGESLRIEEAKARVGTARYMAPEKLKGSIDSRNIWRSLCLIDIYASSIVTYEIMTRCNFEFSFKKEGYYEAADYAPPFREHVGSQPSNEQMKKLVVCNDIRPTIPKEWEMEKVVRQIKKLILKCWDKKPSGRISADEVFDEIQNIFINHESEPCGSGVEAGMQFADTDNLINQNDCMVEINANACCYNAAHDGKTTCL